MNTDVATFPLIDGIGLKRQSKKKSEGKPLTDYALAQKAAGGDMGAFEALYERHRRRVYSLCLRITQNASEAEGLAQEVFIQLFRKVGGFRGCSAFTTWLLRVSVDL